MLKVKTRQQLAAEYGISVRTLNRWFEKSDLPIRRRDILSPKMVEQIYEHFGRPIMSDEVESMPENAIGQLK